MQHTSSRPNDGTPAGQASTSPLVSIVVPVRNEAPHLRATLEGLLAQQAPSPYEILVVDGDSDDGTSALIAALAERHACVHALRNPKRGVAAARNIGIAAARGELIVIVDGHCAVDGPLWLSKLIGVFARTGADCVGFPQPLAVDGGHTQRVIALARASALGRHPGSANYASDDRFVPAFGNAVAYKAAVFAKVGGFDESFDAAEDMELNYRVDGAGLPCFFTAAICTRYQPRSTLRSLFHQQWRYGRGRMRLWRKHPATFSAATFLPPAVLLAVAASCLLLPRPLLVAVGIVYAVAVSISVAAEARRSGAWRLLPESIVALVTVHLGAGLGSLWELARGAHKAAEPQLSPPVSSRSGQASST